MKNIGMFTIKFVFFMSGFSALIYQIAWQRMLFTAFGVDLESITIIIAVFMAGLGIGAYWGGRIADKFPTNMIGLFAMAEVGIGTFGLMSPFLIETTQAIFLYSDTLTIAIANFMLLLFPTFLMGSTLPLLTQYLNQYIDNIGNNIGWLYFTNTLGAASACFTVGFFLFNYFTLTEVIGIAGIVNYIVALIVFVKYGRKGIKNV
ncbi:fused MFS/spermidine synthase [Glaesserella sp.]|uniref:fused MFS/spermidine synthase n=1 Tax=Glaesserella sp. TaxID=2094731 RepID=UPI0035A00C52